MWPSSGVHDTPTPRRKSPHPTLQEYIHSATSHLHPLMQIIQRVISAAQNSRVGFCITWFCIWHSTEPHPFSCSRFVRPRWGKGKQSSPHGKEKDAGGQGLRKEKTTNPGRAPSKLERV